MKILINDRYSIHSTLGTSLALVETKAGTIRGKEAMTEVIIGHFPSFDKAVAYYVKHTLNTSDITYPSMKEYIQEHARLVKEVEHIARGEFE